MALRALGYDLKQQASIEKALPRLNDKGLFYAHGCYGSTCLLSMDTLEPT